jgi:hypothetical protein
MLDSTALTRALTSLCQDPPDSARECAVSWADALAAYFTAVTPPSTTVPVGKPALVRALSAAFSTVDSYDQLEDALSKYAAAVALGMSPLFQGTPPSALVGFKRLRRSRDTSRQAAQDLAQAIHVWALTGIATNTAGFTQTWL